MNTCIVHIRVQSCTVCVQVVPFFCQSIDFMVPFKRAQTLDYPESSHHEESIFFKLPS